MWPTLMKSIGQKIGVSSIFGFEMVALYISWKPLAHM